ncbi:non-ribosomal peptide synthetase [Micromonospora sp. DT178]|uniref:non-ribosomal peptide synthetase n=1 Tax=Micromonospora sp. DT178 TaxID=3393436 RepID=UPI003CF38140
MSPEQESIWLNDQFQEGASRYVESWAYRLRGRPIDPVAARLALTGIVHRHEALRSRLELVDGRPWQTVLPPCEVDLEVREVAPAALAAAMRAAATRTVPLNQPPLLRATLLRVAEDDCCLVLAIHHAVLDGWSFGLLDREFSALYQAATDGVDSSLAEIPLQFGPYARARHLTRSADHSESMKYWLEVLQGVPEESSFPTDRPRPAALGSRGDRVGFRLDDSLGAGIRDLAREARVTPFAVLAAALTALLHRLSGRDDVVIGTPVSRRDDENLEPMIACLADLMPLRSRVTPGTTFAQLLKQTMRQIWGAVAHSDVPYSHMVRALGMKRSPSRFPLFQVVFGVDDSPPAGLRLSGTTAERLYIDAGRAKYDIFLHMVPAGGGFDGYLEFATDLFDSVSINRLVARLRVLLVDAVARPGTPVRNLRILPEAERRLILATWAPGADPLARPSLAHEAFARQALRTPGAEAVVHGHRRLSYRQLDEAADAVARHLVARGTAGRPVGVCLNRGTNLAIGVLAVLKAGGSCLPIDPSYPPERIAFMAADSGIRVVLTEPGLADPIPAGVERISLADPPDAPGTILPVAAPSDLAYLIYTSGSTGQPKGVAMPHSALANLLTWQARRSVAGPGTRTLQFSALSFDVAFQELFSTWATGGSLVMVDEQTRRDPGRLLDLIASERVERLFLPFVALQQIAEFACATGRTADSLREVVTAGEQLIVTPALRDFFRLRAPRAVLENQYGPSETHVVTAERLPDDSAAWPELPPIGCPVDGTFVVLLNSERELCPIGVPGELYVGGTALALGYLGRPELTVERFVDDPFHPGRVLYRTGDLARHLPDGRIQYLGRLDDQIKIRGYRVETGEVASAVQAVPGVAHAAVVARDHAGHRQLVAYYVPAADALVEPDDLRRALSRRLPDYMVPSVCVPVPAMPRTSSGKVDLAALPISNGKAAQPGQRLVKPQTATERSLAGIWRELLGADSIGIHDDFFALGGHSLLATRLVLRIHQDHGVEVPLHALAAAPTIAGLAALVDRAEPVGQSRSRVDLAAEAELPADIVAASEVIRVMERPAHALLTGATGFLGAFLLRSLLDRTDATVHCLVRGPDRDRAAERLRRVLTGYGLAEGIAEHRIKVLAGDLALSGLGLSGEEFDDLVRRIDVVYHVGAAVNLVSPYDRLKAATVNGTEEILRLAARERTVPVHHVSTVGVYAAASDRPIGPEHPIGPADALTHGYTQSKWVAEGLIGAARARSLPVTMYRPTRITGHSRTGACQRGDYLWLILKGCVQAGAAPAGVNTAFDLVPVDYVADAIVTLSLRGSAAGRTFHLASGRLLRLETALGWLRSRGYAIEAIPPAAWRDRIASDPGNAAFPLVSSLAEETTGAGSEGGLIFDPGATDTELRDSGVPRPQVDEAVFGACVNYFTGTGWLPMGQVIA